MDKPTEWKLVPVIPTPEMLAEVDDDAEDKYVARGRAFSAYQAMLAVAPAVQGEPVAWLEGEPSMRGATLSNLTVLTRSTRLHLTKPSTSNPVWPLYTAPQPAPDVSQLVEALEYANAELLAWRVAYGDVGDLYATDAAIRKAKAALAAHRQQGGDV